MRELKITKNKDKKMSNIEMAKAQANADENEVSGVPVKKHNVNWDDEAKAAYDQEILRITKDDEEYEVKKPTPKKPGPSSPKDKAAGIKSFLEKRYNTGAVKAGAKGAAVKGKNIPYRKQFSGEKQLELQKSEMKGTHVTGSKNKAEKITGYEDRLGFIEEDIFNQDGKATEQQKKDIARLKQAISDIRKED